jgi:ABC-2 type transport system permease protein
VLTSLLAVMVKELRQTFRDKRAAFLLLMAPVIQLVVLGYAVDLDVEEVPTVVVDLDRGPRSREMTRGLTAGSVFERVAETRDPEQAQRMLEDGRAAVAVIIPLGFGRDLDHGRQVQVQVLVDGTDPNRAQVASNAAAQYFNTAAVEVALQQLERAAGQRGATLSMPQVRMEPRVYYNPGLDSAVYMVPGVLGMLLVVVTSIVTSMGLARENESGTMEQLMVTPIRPGVLLTGKCLPFAFIGLITVAAVLVFGSLLFQVPIRGSLIVVFSASVLYLMTTLGMGIFIATVTSSQQQAVLGTLFFVMPAVLLSGFMTPIENMPDWIKPITVINPMKYYVEILRACLLKGAGFADLGWHFLALFLLGAEILTFSTLRFQKRLA